MLISFAFLTYFTVSHHFTLHFILFHKQMQQSFPDIKTLYQRKFISACSSPPNHTSKDPKGVLLQRAQRFHDRFSPHMQHSSRPAYIKIIKQSPISQLNRTDTVPIAAAGVAPSPNNLKNTHSSMMFRPRQDLTQILQVSQQELAELQSSLGGEKTLMGLLNTFFLRRHQRQQASRGHRSSSEFRPMKNVVVRRYQEERSGQFRIKKELGGREEGKQKERELAPWSVQDIQPL